MSERTGQTFADVFYLLKDGNGITREKWLSVNGNEIIQLQVPDENSKMTEPYIYKFGHNSKYPYQLTTEDILADDWYGVDLETKES